MSIALVLLAQSIWGAMVRNWISDLKVPPWYWAHVKQVHKMAGWGLFLAGLINMVFGAQMLLLNGRVMMLVYDGMIVAIFAYYLIFDWFDMRSSSLRKVQEGINQRRLAMSQSKVSMTITDIRNIVRSGTKAVMLQGYVYDIGTYYSVSPRALLADVYLIFLLPALSSLSRPPPSPYTLSHL